MYGRQNNQSICRAEEDELAQGSQGLLAGEGRSCADQVHPGLCMQTNIKVYSYLEASGAEAGPIAADSSPASPAPAAAGHFSHATLTTITWPR